MSNNYIDVAKTIYDAIKKDVSKIPQFYFQLGLSINNGTIFTVSEVTNELYFNSKGVYCYIIRLYEPKWNHAEQVDTILKIYKFLTSDEFKQKVYPQGKTSCIYIDDKPNPDFFNLTPNMETYNETTQAYSIKLSIVLEKE